MSIERLINKRRAAILALADGSLFTGIAIGAIGQTVGEVVFNTSMTGYQEILTDPSYFEQIVTLTYPHIGNVGINSNDAESNQVWAKGLIIRDLSIIQSNWRSTQALEDYLIENNIVAIAEVDTRQLTRILRDKGAQHGCIMSDDIDPQVAIAQAQAYPGISGQDLAKVVCTQSKTTWAQASLRLDHSSSTQTLPYYQVVVYDFGVKSQILRLLVDKGCQLTLVPAQTPAAEVLAMKPDGVVLSNGPGDPAACDYAITAISELIAKGLPLFGICLGFQLLGLACGAKTQKMKFGHHGANHPVLDLETQKVWITTQNHGFCVDENSLPDCLKITHRSLFDNTLQGFAHKTQPVFAFQGHPEASPGPHDIVYLFDQFIEIMNKNKVKANAKKN